MNNVDIRLLKEIADLEGTPKGAYNIRKNGQLDSRKTTANIDIVTKEDKPGIDIHIKPGTKHQSVHIPVLLTETGLDDLVYNDFFIGPDCDVVIVAGCGIHNEGSETSKHDGVHTFYVGENSKVHYVEKHYGEGEGTGERIMNPQTIVYLEKGASIQLDTTQLRGVDSTRRYTKVVVKEDAEGFINEKLLTHGKQKAESEMDVILAGPNAKGRVVSRSVAKDESQQIFYPRMIGDAAGFGHVPLKRKLCVLLRHLKPAAPHGLRLMHKLNAPARKFRQCLLQRPRVRCIRTDHGLRNLTSGVVLCNKGFENV